MPEEKKTSDERWIRSIRKLVVSRITSHLELEWFHTHICTACVRTFVLLVLTPHFGKDPSWTAHAVLLFSISEDMCSALFTIMDCMCSAFIHDQGVHI